MRRQCRGSRAERPYSDYSHSEGKIKMTMVIREARLQDSTAIVRLICEHASLTNETSPLTEAYLATYLASPISTILVAEADRHVVGLLSWSVRPDLYHAGDVCLIEELVVKQERRDQGIGGTLMQELFARLASHGCVEIAVAVMPENADAIRFYRSHGLCDQALSLELHPPSEMGARHLLTDDL
jgi:ribosomal protein S18 acetylase RimI-like enzyme